MKKPILSLALLVGLIAHATAGLADAPRGKNAPRSERKSEKKAEEGSDDAPSVAGDPGPPPPKGSGEIAGGIVMTSVGPSLALLALIIGPGCYDSSAVCEQNKRDLGLFELVTAGVGIGVGVPLIGRGVDKRHEWKQWKTEKDAFDAEQGEKESSLWHLDLAPTSGRGLALVLNGSI